MGGKFKFNIFGKDNDESQAENLSSLEVELLDVLVKYHRPDISNTPDYILAEFLMDSLRSYERAVVSRDNFNKNKQAGK